MKNPFKRRFTVPISRCKKCKRYQNGYCPLEDLSPCVFIPKLKEKKK